MATDVQLQTTSCPVGRNTLNFNFNVMMVCLGAKGPRDSKYTRHSYYVYVLSSYSIPSSGTKKSDKLQPIATCQVICIKEK